MNKIVLLGTGGGPRIWAARSQPSNALIINDEIYIDNSKFRKQTLDLKFCL